MHLLLFKTQALRKPQKTSKEIKMIHEGTQIKPCLGLKKEELQFTQCEEIDMSKNH